MADEEARKINNRAAASIIGALIADAAVNPLHWVYDRHKLDCYLQESSTPEFYSKWGTPFYKVPVGAFSCYGDQAYCLLKSITNNRGFDLGEYCKDIYDWFGPESPYREPNPSKDFPKQGPWRNGNITRSLDNLHEGKLQNGSDEAESDSFSKVIPLVALYAGNKDLKKKIEEVVRTTLNNDKAVETAIAFGNLLETAILNGKFDVQEWYDKLDQSDIKEEIRVVLEAKDEPHITQAKVFGIGCSLPGSFQNAIHCLVQGEDYVGSVRQALSAGGGNCARAMAVGALVTASQSSDAIPADWIEKTIHGKEIVTLAQNLVSLRT